MRNFLSPAFIILLILQTYVFSGDPIAVNELGSSGITKSEALSLTDALRVEIGNTGKYEVMERGQMEIVLKEQGFQQSGACDASCAIEIGKLLSVKYMVLGNIGKVGKTFSLNIRLVEVGTGKIISDISENHKGSIDDLLTKKVPIAAQKLAGTYKKEKKGKKGIVIASISVLVVAGFGIPVAILFTKDDDTEISTTGVKVIWDE